MENVSSHYGNGRMRKPWAAAHILILNMGQNKNGEEWTSVIDTNYFPFKSYSHFCQCSKSYQLPVVVSRNAILFLKICAIDFIKL